VLLILVVRVVSFMSKRIVIHAMETTVMVGAIIEVLRVVVSVVVSVLHLVVGVVVVRVVVHGNVLGLVVMVVQRQVVVDIVMRLMFHEVVRVLMVVSIHALNVMVVVVKLMSQLMLVLDVVGVSINLNRLEDGDAVVRVLQVQILVWNRVLLGSILLRGLLLGSGIGVGVLVRVATVSVRVVVFLRFVMARLLVVSLAQTVTVFPASAVVIFGSVLTVAGVVAVSLP